MTDPTLESYIDNINENFPIPGRDNNSQGLRDNFANIKDGLTYIKDNYAGYTGSIGYVGSRGSVQLFVINNTYTAEIGQCIASDTSAGPFIITLPTSPNDGDFVEFFDLAQTWPDNNLTIARNGQLINNIDEDLICDFSMYFRITFYEGSWWVQRGVSGVPGATGSTGATGAAMESPSQTVTFISNAYTTVSTDLRKTLLITTGSVDKTLTLQSASEIDDGVIIAFRKSDTGVGVCNVTDGTSSLAYLMTQDDRVRLRVNGNIWEVIDHTISPRRLIYTSSDTWTKRTLLKYINVVAISGGSSGASGRRGATLTNRWGGGGGPGGSVNFLTLNYNDLPSSVSVTVAAPTTGGDAILVDDTNGNPGIAGNDTSFGSLVIARAGNAPSGGTSTAGSGGVSSLSTTMRTPCPNGGSSSVTATPSLPGTAPVGAGAGGGGINNSNVAHAGGNTSIASSASNPYISGAAGGASDGSNGENGTSISYPEKQEGGAGGAGGGGNESGSGGNGGNGGNPGGGGGGGGASLNGYASGKGGDGARGELRIYEVY